jgi:hypothetical protein
MATCPVESLRTKAYNCFQRLFQKVSDYVKVQLLSRMLLEDDYSNIPPLALSLVKDAIHQTSSTSTSSVFQSEIIMDHFIKPAISLSFPTNKKVFDPNLPSAEATLLEFAPFYVQFLNFITYLLIHEYPFQKVCDAKPSLKCRCLPLVSVKSSAC